MVPRTPAAGPRTDGAGRTIPAMRKNKSALLVLAAILVPRRLRDPLAASGVVIAVLLLLSPTVHPWYVLWIVPFLCIYPNPAWIGFTGLVTLSYTALHVLETTGVWQLPTTILAIEYIPFYCFLIYGFLKHKKNRRGQACLAR